MDENSAMHRSYITEEGIDHLIKSPKKIVEKDPKRGFKEKGLNRFFDLGVKSDLSPKVGIFARQNIRFPRNFSVGLQLQIEDGREVTLVRYNGPHGKHASTPDRHYVLPHIHRVTADEIAKDNIKPQAKYIQTTDKYENFNQALEVFLFDVGITNRHEFFPRQLSLPLFSNETE